MNGQSQHTPDLLTQPWPDGVLVVVSCSGEDAPVLQPLAPDVASRVAPEFWSTLNDALATLAAQDCATALSTWVFETALLFIARREEGDWCGVVMTRELSAAAREFVQARLEEFATAQPAVS